jgi:hypothetical protein
VPSLGGSRSCAAACEIVGRDDAVRSKRGTPSAVLHDMKHLKKTIVAAVLTSVLGSAVASCYIERRGPRYAHRTCAYGYYWNGYRCHHVRRW